MEEPVSDHVDAFGDAAAPSELERAVADAISGTHSMANGHHHMEVQPEEPPAALEDDSWEDPAIASSGTAADWTKPALPPMPASQPPNTSPEPVRTYPGPPGFNIGAVRTAAGLPASRTGSRATQRLKAADAQGVVLPASANSLSGMEMQFGTLSFGGAGGDGVDKPVPISEAKVSTPTAAQLPVLPSLTSPVRQPQLPSIAPAAPAPAPPTLMPASQATVAPTQAYPFYGQQAATHLSSGLTSSLAPTSQQPSQPAVPSYHPPHQTLQQQMQSYQAQQTQYNGPAAPTSAPSASLGQESQNPYYRSHDFYNSMTSQSQPQQAEPEQPSAQPQPAPSSYDNGLSAYGGQHFGAQPTSNNDYGSTRPYDSYTASGYPRPTSEETKPAAPAAGQSATSGSLPPQQSGYYSQNMGYYQNAPYNPYYQCECKRIESPRGLISQMGNRRIPVSSNTTPWPVVMCTVRARLRLKLRNPPSPVNRLLLTRHPLLMALGHLMTFRPSLPLRQQRIRHDSPKRAPRATARLHPTRTSIRLRTTSVSLTRETKRPPLRRITNRRPRPARTQLRRQRRPPSKAKAAPKGKAAMEGTTITASTAMPIGARMVIKGLMGDLKVIRTGNSETTQIYHVNFLPKTPTYDVYDQDHRCGCDHS